METTVNIIEFIYSAAWVGLILSPFVNDKHGNAVVISSFLLCIAALFTIFLANL